MKASVGSIDITPGDGVGYPMAGYSRPHASSGVLDPVQASGVLIEDEHPRVPGVKRRLLLVAIDTLKLPLVFCDYVKENIQDATGIAPNQILLHAVHTHQAPDLTGEYHWPGGVVATIRGVMFGLNRNDRYMVLVARRIVALARQLVRDLRPCKMAWARTVVTDEIIVNRRHPTRRSTSDLVTWSFTDAVTGEVFGMLVNFSCHPTTLPASNDKLSADFPGQVLASISSMSGGRIAAAFFNGPSGDINPITTCGTDYEHLDVNKIYSQNGTYEHTTAMGRVIATRALELVRSLDASAYFDRFAFKSHVRTVAIPLRDFDRYPSATPAKATLVRLQNRAVFLVKKYFLLPIVLSIASGKKPNFPGLAVKHRGFAMNCYSKLQHVEITLASKGGREATFSLMGLPGELFEDVGNRFKAASPAGPERTVIVQNANDWVSYFFDLDEYTQQGGLEPFEGTTPVAGYYVKKLYLAFLDEIQAGLAAGHA